MITFSPDSEMREVNDPDSRFTTKAQRCHAHVQKRNDEQGGDYNPYAVCTASIGYEGSYRKAHRRKKD